MLQSSSPFYQGYNIIFIYLIFPSRIAFYFLFFSSFILEKLYQRVVMFGDRVILSRINFILKKLDDVIENYFYQFFRGYPRIRKIIVRDREDQIRMSSSSFYLGISSSLNMEFLPVTRFQYSLTMAMWVRVQTTSSRLTTTHLLKRVWWNVKVHQDMLLWHCSELC